jgi:hypothetical protein
MHLPGDGVLMLCCIAAGKLESERGFGIEQLAQLPPKSGNVSLKYLKCSCQDRQLICD